jgi:enamine deaminase RidA (YjgF/YER057c/UK114 family)
MNRPVAPPGVAPPAAAYSLAVATEAPSRLLHTSGIVPTRPDGSVPEALADQVEVVWTSLLAIVDEGGMAVTDVVSITTYVVAGGDLGVVMAGRDRAMAGHRPASTLVVVPALARPEWQVEISLVAAA